MVLSRSLIIPLYLTEKITMLCIQVFKKTKKRSKDLPNSINETSRQDIRKFQRISFSTSCFLWFVPFYFSNFCQIAMSLFKIGTKPHYVVYLDQYCERGQETSNLEVEWQWSRRNGNLWYLVLLTTCKYFYVCIKNSTKGTGMKLIFQRISRNQKKCRTLVFVYLSCLISQSP